MAADISSEELLKERLKHLIKLQEKKEGKEIDYDYYMNDSDSSASSEDMIAPISNDKIVNKLSELQSVDLDKLLEKEIDPIKSKESNNNRNKAEELQDDNFSECGSLNSIESEDKEWDMIETSLDKHVDIVPQWPGSKKHVTKSEIISKDSTDIKVHKDPSINEKTSSVTKKLNNNEQNITNLNDFKLIKSTLTNATPAQLEDNDKLKSIPEVNLIQKDVSKLTETKKETIPLTNAITKPTNKEKLNSIDKEFIDKDSLNNQLTNKNSNINLLSNLLLSTKSEGKPQTDNNDADSNKTEDTTKNVKSTKIVKLSSIYQSNKQKKKKIASSEKSDPKKKSSIKKEADKSSVNMMPNSTSKKPPKVNEVKDEKKTIKKELKKSNSTVEQTKIEISKEVKKEKLLHEEHAISFSNKESESTSSNSVIENKVKDNMLKAKISPKAMETLPNSDAIQKDSSTEESINFKTQKKSIDPNKTPKTLNSLIVTPLDAHDNIPLETNNPAKLQVLEKSASNIDEITEDKKKKNNSLDTNDENISSINNEKCNSKETLDDIKKKTEETDKSNTISKQILPKNISPCITPTKSTYLQSYLQSVEDIRKSPVNKETSLKNINKLNKERLSGTVPFKFHSFMHTNQGHSKSKANPSNDKLINVTQDISVDKDKKEVDSMSLGRNTQESVVVDTKDKEKDEKDDKYDKDKSFKLEDKRDESNFTKAAHNKSTIKIIKESNMETNKTANSFLEAKNSIHNILERENDFASKQPEIVRNNVDIQEIELKTNNANFSEENIILDLNYRSSIENLPMLERNSMVIMRSPVPVLDDNRSTVSIESIETPIIEIMERSSTPFSLQKGENTFFNNKINVDIHSDKTSEYVNASIITTKDTFSLEKTVFQLNHTELKQNSLKTQVQSYNDLHLDKDILNYSEQSLTESNIRGSQASNIIIADTNDNSKLLLSNKKNPQEETISMIKRTDQGETNKIYAKKLKKNERKHQKILEKYEKMFKESSNSMAHIDNKISNIVYEVETSLRSEKEEKMNSHFDSTLKKNTSHPNSDAMIKLNEKENNIETKIDISTTTKDNLDINHSQRSSLKNLPNKVSKDRKSFEYNNNIKRPLLRTKSSFNNRRYNDKKKKSKYKSRIPYKIYNNLYKTGSKNKQIIAPINPIFQLENVDPKKTIKHGDTLDLSFTVTNGILIQLSGKPRKSNDLFFSKRSKMSTCVNLDYYSKQSKNSANHERTRHEMQLGHEHKVQIVGISSKHYLRGGDEISILRNDGLYLRCQKFSRKLKFGREKGCRSRFTIVGVPLKTFLSIGTKFYLQTCYDPYKIIGFYPIGNTINKNFIGYLGLYDTREHISNSKVTEPAQFFKKNSTYI